MSEPVSISSGIAARYATAVFEIARDDNAFSALDSDLDALDGALRGSADFRALIASPVVTREEQGRAIAALAEKMGLSLMMRNTLALMASRRRLFVLPQLVAALRARLAEARGEVTAEVTAARPLSDTQSNALARTLKDVVGREVKINLAVDESLIGGLVVKVGSKMIDTSIRARLAKLQNAMKEVR